LYFKNNIITEFPRSNVFMVTAGNKLVTPAHNILKGITRKNILSIAAEIIPVEERDITVDELLNASEVFLSATTKKIIPIVKIDGQVIANGKPGDVTSLLYQKFMELEKSFTHLVSR
jgi:branched-chain amino acid aminotransferase